MYNYDNICEFKTLIGKILSKVENNGSDIIFTEDNGQKWVLTHFQDCCESVNVEDVCGDLEDLIGVPIVMADEATSRDDPEDLKNKYSELEYRESYTWTFYKLATVKGYVTIRFYGASNGYYSESVSFVKVN